MKMKKITIVAIVLLSILSATVTAATKPPSSFVIVQKVEVAQVVDEKTILVWLDDSTSLTCICGIPTRSLYEGVALPKNTPEGIFLVFYGVYTYESITGQRQIRRLLWIHPSRIRVARDTQRGDRLSTCSRCGGSGELEQRKGKMGRRVCSYCGGAGQVSHTKNKSKKTIFVDGREMK